MSLTITHPFVSAVADSGNTSLVQPSNWNANHTVVGNATATTGYVLVAQGSGAAPIWSASFPSIITFPDGNVAAPSITFTNEPTTGLYRVGAGELGFSILGTKELGLTATALSPGASDGSALGTSSLMWADAFFASGAVINFNAGDVTLTHAADTLTLSGDTLASLVFAHAGTKEATTTTAASATFAGGVGIAKALRIGSTAASTAYTNGALIVAGGIGAAGTSTLGGTLSIFPSSGNAIYSQASVGNAIFAMIDSSSTNQWNYYVNTDGSYSVYNVGAAATALHINGTTNQITIAATTQATTTSDGALYTPGGLSVVKNAVIGGSLSVTSTGSFGSTVTNTVTSSGARTTGLILWNNAGAANTAISLDFTPNTNVPLARINANRTDAVVGGDTQLEFSTYNSGLATRMTIGPSGIVTLADTTASTSNTTGALVVSGGAGFAKDVYLATGTTAIAPLTFTSGTNLTTARAGGVEFDGTCFYATSVASSRQVVGAEQLAVIQTDNTLADVATAQNVFAGANDVLSLAASTAYEFEFFYWITRAAGTTSHTTSLLFPASSAFTSIHYTAQVTNPTGNALANVQQIVGDVSTGVVITAANTVATENIIVWGRGVIRTNAASTVTPQFQYSAAPGGAPTVKVDSFFRIWPVGSNTVAAVGNWA